MYPAKCSYEMKNFRQLEWYAFLFLPSSISFSAYIYLFHISLPAWLYFFDQKMKVHALKGKLALIDYKGSLIDYKNYNETTKSWI